MTQCLRMQLSSKASASNQLDAHDADELLIVHRCNTPEANCSHKHAVLWRGAADGSGACALDKSYSLTQHTRAGARACTRTRTQQCTHAHTLRRCCMYRAVFTQMPTRQSLR